MKLPVLPTITVLIAVPILIALGFWQLDRLAWKEALLVDLAHAPQKPAIDLDQEGVAPENFRRADITCRAVGMPQIVAGRSLTGQAGFSYRIPCRSVHSANSIMLDLGWAARPDTAARVGLFGTYSGLLVDRFSDEGTSAARFLLVPDRPVLASLGASAPPQMDAIPNNHRAYAVQWFAFAGVLIAIYILFLRQWQRRGDADESAPTGGEGDSRVAPPRRKG